jgi:hypothetical protein
MKLQIAECTIIDGGLEIIINPKESIFIEGLRVDIHWKEKYIFNYYKYLKDKDTWILNHKQKLEHIL